MEQQWKTCLFYVKKCLFPKVLEIGTRIQNTQHILSIIDDLNKDRNLHENWVGAIVLLYPPSFLLIILVQNFMLIKNHIDTWV